MSGGGVVGSVLGGIAGFLVGGPAGAAIGAGLGGSTGMQADAGKKQAKAAEEANRIAQDAAAKNAKAMDEAANRANAKSPDLTAMLSANEQAAKGGVAGTMLTGATGIDPSTLQLGKNTLLGN